MSNKNTNKTKIIFTIMLILIAASLYVSFSINKKIDSNVSELREYKKNILESSQIFSSEENLRNELERIQKLDNQLEAVYLNDSEKVSFLEDVERMARARSLVFEITSAIPDNTNLTSGGYGFLKIGMKGTGSENALKSFISDLENLPRAIFFNSVKFSKNNDAETIGSHVMEINFSIMTK